MSLCCHSPILVQNIPYCLCGYYFCRLCLCFYLFRLLTLDHHRGHIFRSLSCHLLFLSSVILFINSIPSIPSILSRLGFFLLPSSFFLHFVSPRLGEAPCIRRWLAHVHLPCAAAASLPTLAASTWRSPPTRPPFQQLRRGHIQTSFSQTSKTSSLPRSRMLLCFSLY